MESALKTLIVFAFIASGVQGELTYDDMEMMLADGFSNTDDFNHGPNVRPVVGNLWNKRIDANGNYQVPYVLSPLLKLNQAGVIAIKKVMAEFASKTCVNFVPRVSSLHVDYVTFNPGRRCRTATGRLGGNQQVLLTEWCLRRTRILGLILMRTLGFGRLRGFGDFFNEAMRPEDNLIDVIDSYRGGALTVIDVRSVVSAYKCFQTTTSPPITTIAPAEKCGYPQATYMLPKIVGGKEVLPGRYPWQISLRVRYNDKAFCGGSVINNQWIVTAAHCFRMSQNPRLYALYVGKHHKDTADPSEKRHLLAKVIVHENYNPDTKLNDIAVIKVATPITMGKYVQPICLPTGSSDVPIPGTMLTVTGWGLTHNTGDNNVLRAVQVPMINDEVCRKLLPPVQDGMMCAGFKEGGKDACGGDSGGPLAMKKPTGQYNLVGVVSWGIGCGEPNKPGVYSSVAFYLDWIKNAMQQSDWF